VDKLNNAAINWKENRVSAIMRKQYSGNSTVNKAWIKDTLNTLQKYNG